MIPRRRDLATLITIALACTAVPSAPSDKFWAKTRKGDKLSAGGPAQRSLRPSPQIRIADSKPGSSPDTEIDVTDAFGEPGKPLAIQIELPPQSSSEAFFVRITGIPTPFAVSRGTRSGTDWLLTANDLKSLTITAPESFSGGFAIGVRLFDIEHKVVAAGTAFVTIKERKVAMGSAGAGTAADKVETRPASQSEPVPQNPVTSNLVTPEEEALQLQRSEILLKSGDISSARLILETLSDEGSGRAAHALGRTYDPQFFRSNFIRGMAPEPAKAAFWYKKAIELGYKEAGGAMSSQETGH